MEQIRCIGLDTNNVVQGVRIEMFWQGETKCRRAPRKIEFQFVLLARSRTAYHWRAILSASRMVIENITGTEWGKAKLPLSIKESLKSNMQDTSVSTMN